MPVAVAEAVAASANRWAPDNERFSVVWHGGEPLSAGRGHLASLMAPFDGGIEQHVQTNAHPGRRPVVRVLPRARRARRAQHRRPARSSTSLRVDWAGRPAYDRIMRGVAALRRHGIRFAVICVVSDPRPGLAQELYEFFADLGCFWLGVNIEEREGVNTRDNARSAEAVQAFWAELAAAWLADPRIELREIEWALRYAGGVLAGDADELLPRQRDPIPTVASDGRVVLFSPELAGLHRPALRGLRLGQRARPTPARDRHRDDHGAERVDRRVPVRDGELPRLLSVLRVLRRWPGVQPALRARPVRRHGHGALPRHEDPPTRGSVGPCPSKLTR